jgi:hypothetical protein
MDARQILNELARVQHQAAHIRSNFDDSIKSRKACQRHSLERKSAAQSVLRTMAST